MAKLDRYTCEDLFRLLDDYVDQRLTPEQSELVLQHLGICSVCAAEYQFERAVLDGVRERIRKIEFPEGLLEKITSRIRNDVPAPKPGP